MGNGIFVLPDLIRIEEKSIRKLERELKGKNYGNLYIKNKGKNVFFVEYIDGKQVWIKKDMDRVYAIARHQYVNKLILARKEALNVLQKAESEIAKINKTYDADGLLEKYSALNQERIKFSSA